MKLLSLAGKLLAGAVLAAVAYGASAQKTQLTVYTALETDQLKAYQAGFEDMPRRVPDLSRVSGLIGYAPTLSLACDARSTRCVPGRRSASARSTGRTTSTPRSSGAPTTCPDRGV